MERKKCYNIDIDTVFLFLYNRISQGNKVPDSKVNSTYEK